MVSGKTVTRKKFYENITVAINLLKWKGFSTNDRVLVVMYPSIEFYAMAVAVLAIGTGSGSLLLSFYLNMILRTGGVLVLIDASMGLERCNHCIATAKPSLWVWEKGSKLRFLKVCIAVFICLFCVQLQHLVILCFERPLRVVGFYENWW